MERNNPNSRSDGGTEPATDETQALESDAEAASDDIDDQVRDNSEGVVRDEDATDPDADDAVVSDGETEPMGPDADDDHVDAVAAVVSAIERLADGDSPELGAETVADMVLDHADDPDVDRARLVKVAEKKLASDRFLDTSGNNIRERNQAPSMGLPINGNPLNSSGRAFDHYWDNIVGRLRGGDTRHVVTAFKNLVDNDVYAVDTSKLASLVAKVGNKPAGWNVQNMLALNAFQEDHLEATGMFQKNSLLGDDNRVVYLLDEQVIEMVESAFGSGMPSPPSEQACAVGTYLGAADLVDRPLVPCEAWLYATVVQLAYLPTPDVTINQFGNPDDGDWQDEYPYGDYLLGDSFEGNYAEYVIDVDIETAADNLRMRPSSAGGLQVSNVGLREALKDALLEEIVRYHGAALYDDYGSFSLDASRATIREGQPEPDARTGGLDSYLPAFYRTVEIGDDGHIRIVSLYQRRQT
jgi:hypothetical protein